MANVTNVMFAKNKCAPLFLHTTENKARTASNEKNGTLPMDK